jgi:hypothetical protein
MASVSPPSIPPTRGAAEPSHGRGRDGDGYAESSLGARLLLLHRGSARADEDEVAFLARPIGDVLASCIDLRGAVAVHDVLRTPPKPTAPFPKLADRSAIAAKLRAAIVARLEVIRTRLVATLESRLRTKLPDAEEFAAVLIESKALATRRPKDLEKASVELYADYRNMLRAGVERIRAELQMLRDELAEDLRPFGPLAFRLDALDATLRKATTARVNRLIERIPGVLETPFREMLTEEVKRLPKEVPADHFRALHRRMEDRFLAEGRELLLAFFQVERRTLDALVSEEVLCRSL